jgi:RecA-family ATPase
VSAQLEVMQGRIERKLREATAEDPRAVALDFAALAQLQAPKRHWFVPGWLGGPTLVAGVGGSGKSSLVQHLVTMGALGRPYIAPQDTPFTSMLWSCEDDHDELWRRQERICAHEQIDMADLADRLHIFSRYGCDNALMLELQGSGLAATPLMKELREQVNDLAVDTLWLDNVAHMFLGNHDDRTHVTAFINALNGLVTGRPFAAVIVAHPGKAVGSEYSGSVAWENAVRMRWFLGSRLPDQPIEPGEEDADRGKVRFLCKRKTNYSAQDFVRFTMDHGLLVPDHEPIEGTSGTLAALDDKRAEEVCVAGFRSLQGMGLHPSDSKAAGDYLPKQILAKGLASGYSKADLTRAMNRLMTAGTFTRGQVSVYSNRTPKFGLVLRQETE